MKEMVYGERTDKSIELDRGVKNDLPYVILNLGSHPCAYVGIPENHLLSKVGYSDIPISVHGGLTFARLGTGDYLPKDYYWFGWDYAHSGDYMGYYKDDAKLVSLGDKKWTTQEILEDVWDVSYQLNKLKELIDMIAKDFLYDQFKTKDTK